MDTAVGDSSIVRVVPDTVATAAPLVKVTSIDDAPAGVPAPITTTVLVAVKTKQDVAAVPELGVAPTLAVQANPGMKLVPVTVMVLPT